MGPFTTGGQEQVSNDGAPPQEEHHRSHRTGWLRGAVLGANDGVVSAGSLLLGVAAAHSSHDGVLIAGVAGTVAGTMAMAAGEYVSVSSQADTERADLRLEQIGIETDEQSERDELAEIYVRRGLERRWPQRSLSSLWHMMHLARTRETNLASPRP